MKGGVSAISIVATCAYFNRGYPLITLQRVVRSGGETYTEISGVSVAD